jgi:hypothetical protein
MGVRGLDGKTAIIGVGAQKAGTSWLYAALARSPAVASSRIKEQHFFDAWLHPDRFGAFHGWFVNRPRAELTRDAGAVVRTDLGRDLLDRVRAIHHPPGYLDHFARLTQPAHIRFLDITPSYALLSTESFAVMKRFLERAGLNVKVVFLMRDPVDRYHSALRMAARDEAAAGRSFSAAANFEAHLQDPQFHDRSRYDRTVRNLEAVFAPEQIFYGFYETMFTAHSLKALTDFIGIPPVAADFARRRNVSPSDGALTDAQLARAYRAFQPVYAFCRERFADTCPRAWYA